MGLQRQAVIAESTLCQWSCVCVLGYLGKTTRGQLCRASILYGGRVSLVASSQTFLQFTLSYGLSPEVFGENIIVMFIIIFTIVMILITNVYWVLTVKQAPFTTIVSFTFSAILGGRYYYYHKFLCEQTDT